MAQGRAGLGRAGQGSGISCRRGRGLRRPRAYIGEIRHPQLTQLLQQIGLHVMMAAFHPQAGLVWGLATHFRLWVSPYSLMTISSLFLNFHD